MLVTQNAAGQDYVTAIVMQTGDRNYAGVNQSANNVSALISQPGNGNYAFLNQTANANAVGNITRSANGGTATINQ